MSMETFGYAGGTFSFEEWGKLSDEERSQFLKGRFDAMLENAFWFGVAVQNVNEVFEARDALTSGDTARARQVAAKAAERMMKKKGVLSL